MSGPWSDRDYGRERGGLVFGLLLIVVGGLFLVGNQLQIDWSNYGWPMWIVVPGLVLLVLGLSVPHEAGLGMAIPGAIITTVGLILAFQDATDSYASWAYVWALVAPGSVGAALFLYGLLHRRLDLLDSGLRTAAVGLALFVGFGLFFENIIGLDENGKTTVLRDAMPFLAVVLGAIIVLINLLPHPKKAEGSISDGWISEPLQPPTPPTPPAPPASPAA